MIVVAVRHFPHHLASFRLINNWHSNDCSTPQLSFTVLSAAVNIVALNGNNYLPTGEAELLTPDEVKTAIFGSKMTLLNEEMMLITTWLVKACLLIMYNKLT
jgi:hypothetical protein